MAEGVRTTAAWRRDIETETNWPGAAPTNPGAGHKIPLRTENITTNAGVRERGVLSGQVSQESPKQNRLSGGGSIDLDLRYGALDRFWALSLGYENPDTDATGGSPHQIAAGVEKHAYECHDIIRSYPWAAGERNASVGSPGDEGHWLAGHRRQNRGGLYIAKQTSVHRIWPAMVNGFQLSATPEDAHVSFDTLGYQTVRQADFGQAGWTFYNNEDPDTSPGLAQVALFELVVHFAVAESTSWLYQDLRIGEFNLSLNNNLRGDTHTSNSKYPVEFWRNGMRQVNGSMMFPQYLDDNFYNLISAGGSVRGQLLFEFTGPVISGGNNAKLVFYLPSCTLRVDEAPVSGPEVLQRRVEFSAEKPLSSSPTSLVTGAGGFLQNITTRKGGELYIGTTNTYDQNVYEND